MHALRSLKLNYALHVRRIYIADMGVDVTSRWDASSQELTILPGGAADNGPPNGANAMAQRPTNAGNGYAPIAGASGASSGIEALPRSGVNAWGVTGTQGAAGSSGRDDGAEEPTSRNMPHYSRGPSAAGRGFNNSGGRGGNGGGRGFNGGGRRNGYNRSNGGSNNNGGGGSRPTQDFDLDRWLASLSGLCNPHSMQRMLLPTTLKLMSRVPVVVGARISALVPGHPTDVMAKLYVQGMPAGQLAAPSARPLSGGEIQPSLLAWENMDD